MSTQSTDARAVFAEKLKQLRKAYKLDQGPFGETIGVSRGSISYYEGEKRTADIQVLMDICNKYDVSADYMLGFTPSPSRDAQVQAAVDSMNLTDHAVRAIRFVNDADNKVEAEREDAEQYPKMIEILNYLLSIPAPRPQSWAPLDSVLSKPPAIHWVVQHIWEAVYSAAHYSPDANYGDKKREYAETGQFLLDPSESERYATQAAENLMNAIIESTIKQMKKKYIDTKEAPDDGEREQGEKAEQ
jgi:transcriptional regulator with XRE-family HTH domain